MKVNEDLTIEQLLEAGWHLYRQLPRWKVFYRRNKELQELFGGAGLEYITVFRNGRTAKGYYNP